MKNKFPNLSDNQLASFFELLTKEPITARNQSSQFTSDKNSSKYPIQNKQTEAELNIILSKFGMKDI
ncbi:hypothetical protein [Chryseobacterium lathyri]|uniref:Uncharacterized protein n=1 Tax=Chryseobacterium lathyri TaxID=395933 RepID=A0ABT9SR20_9FLAO|nr:hypothetical protein [Chryseobacterium lathyri]MDP9961867.1 hypothetical protein [Chryseobacterium lathyri]